MKLARRTLFGLPLAGLLGRQRQEPLAPPAAPVEPWFEWERRSRGPQPRPAPFGPTMEELISLAEANPTHSVYYTGVLWKAIEQTGPVAADTAGWSVIYHVGPIHWPEGARARSFISRADRVPVPESLLKHFRPENRGEEFPRGIPFVPLG
jgi:hypothetical protein